MRLWHGGLIVFAICALTVNIATRYSAWGSESASARTVTTVKTQSQDCQRQRLLSDGLYWMSPVTRSTFLRPPRSTARAISAVLIPKAGFITGLPLPAGPNSFLCAVNVLTAA
jgi:hypothetical protein